ncbi:hypothetical protein [uncultured Chloroflexus sp.]|uniref:hypothetical protein n=1 Tax=uncultured Chloroflexus sp. TaxID=214040 RepID=UPI0026339C49|nr:hypothetical protein [uncultured Chloroflexus sp.]
MALNQVCSQTDDSNRLLGKLGGHGLAVLVSSNGFVIALVSMIGLCRSWASWCIAGLGCASSGLCNQLRVDLVYYQYMVKSVSMSRHSRLTLSLGRRSFLSFDDKKRQDKNKKRQKNMAKKDLNI